MQKKDVEVVEMSKVEIMMNDIKEKLKQQYTQLDYEVFGVFLYGSQNYGLATPSSDIDTKAIIIPSFNDLVLKTPISKRINFPWGECDIKDVREMVKSYKKQNVNFIETLFTDYFVVNPRYQAMYDQIVSKREEIAHYDERKALDCFNGLMMQAKKRLVTPTDNTKGEIEKHGYHPKSFMNICKYAAMAEKYIYGDNYRTVLHSSEYIVFRDPVYPKEETLDLAHRIDENTKAHINGANPKPVNEEIGTWLDEWVKTLIGINIGLN